MLNVNTKERLHVSDGGSGGLYITLPVEQCDAVCLLLKENDLSFWVDEGNISINDQPAFTVINIGFGNAPDAIQEILDRAS